MIVETPETKIARLEVQMAFVRDDLAEVAVDVKAIRGTLAEQKGRIWGVGFTVSTIWAVGVALWQFVSAKIGA